MPIDDFLAHNQGLLDVKINDTNMFFLCNGNELKIFDLATLTAVKVIQTKTNQIQLVYSPFTSSSIIIYCLISLIQLLSIMTREAILKN
jgi:hypothetical protein